MTRVRVDILSGQCRIYDTDGHTGPLHEETERYLKCYTFIADDEGTVRFEGATEGPTIREVVEMSKELYNKVQHKVAIWKHKGVVHKFFPKKSLS